MAMCLQISWLCLQSNFREIYFHPADLAQNVGEEVHAHVGDHFNDVGMAVAC
jgi:hypothetical protein